MMYVVKQTHEEKVAMYMKSKKHELAEMLATRDDVRNAQDKPNWRNLMAEEAREILGDPMISVSVPNTN